MIYAERFERLERQVRRQRNLMLVMALGFAAVLAMGATSTPDELTLRKLTIVDALGKPRIIASPFGGADLEFYDGDGKRRIGVSTFRDGALRFYDQNEKERIEVRAGLQSPIGASLSVKDGDGKTRMNAWTTVDGAASLSLISAELILYNWDVKRVWSKSSD